MSVSKFKPGKLSHEKASEIKKKYYLTKTSTRKLAKEYGVSHQAIFFVVNGSSYGVRDNDYRFVG